MRGRDDSDVEEEGSCGDESWYDKESMRRKYTRRNNLPQKIYIFIFQKKKKSYIYILKRRGYSIYPILSYPTFLKPYVYLYRKPKPKEK